MSPGGGRLSTESSIANQHIPGIPAETAQSSNSELTRGESFWPGGTLGHCSLSSNSYQLPESSPAKLQGRRTDVVFF